MIYQTKLLFIFVLFLTICNALIAKNQEGNKQSERLKNLLTQNDISKIKSFEAIYLEKLFEEDTISAIDLSIQFLNENQISDTISKHLYTFVLLQTSLEKINVDLETINKIDKKIEAQKDELSKKLLQVHDKTSIMIKKDKKKKKSVEENIIYLHCPKDKIQTTINTKLRYFDTDNCNFEIPEEFTEETKNIILMEMEEAFKDKSRTLDINLKAQHQLIDIKNEIVAYINYWTPILEKKSDANIRFDPLGR